MSVEINGDLGQHQSETRHLRETIVALRTELEAASARLETERQRGAAQHEHDRARAAESIGALREQLEGAVVERNAAVQSALVQSADEVAQQQLTIVELRRTLEAERADAARDLGASERAARAERDHLQDIISALRVRLESTDGG